MSTPIKYTVVNPYNGSKQTITIWPPDWFKNAIYIEQPDNITLTKEQLAEIGELFLSLAK